MVISVSLETGLVFFPVFSLNCCDVILSYLAYNNAMIFAQCFLPNPCLTVWIPAKYIFLLSFKLSIERKIPYNSLLCIKLDLDCSSFKLYFCVPGYSCPGRLAYPKDMMLL